MAKHEIASKRMYGTSALSHEEARAWWPCQAWENWLKQAIAENEQKNVNTINNNNYHRSSFNRRNNQKNSRHVLPAEDVEEQPVQVLSASPVDNTPISRPTLSTLPEVESR